MGNMMGNATVSQEHMRELEKTLLQHFVMKLAAGPDLGVNESIVMFCGLDSSDYLRQHYKKRKKKAGKHAADWIKSLAEKLGDLTSAPELAGLGALAIAVFIDNASISRPEESVKETLRCAFAEEKASEVWDLINNSLERCMMHLDNKDELRSYMEQIECQLSTALTKLKDYMVWDGYMSSPTLKAWVNGAACHIQILIHLVRLRGIQTCDSVEQILSVYQSDLEPLFDMHLEVTEAKCSVREKAVCMAPNARYLVDEDLKWHLMSPTTTYDKYFEAYYDHRYSRQKWGIQAYFNGVRQNLQRLVDQTGSFSV